jgi:hypothetical protein
MTKQNQQAFRTAMRLITSVCALSLSILASSIPAQTQEVTTEPVGFCKMTCLSNADTYISIPLL